MKRTLLGLVIALASLQACAQERLLVFAAASLKTALDEVNSEFDASGATRTVASYAASSTLARQIERGAPAQAFLSADIGWMDYLDGKGLIRPGTRRNLLGNQLVWIAPASAAPASAGEPLAALGATGRLALADPAQVPAGKYAKAALQRLGLWGAVSKRIAAAENVRAALALVARGEAPLGIVYRSDALEEPRVRTVAQIAENLHPPIVYPAALTRQAGAAAGAYLEFLSGAKSRAIFRKHGFTPLCC